MFCLPLSPLSSPLIPPVTSAWDAYHINDLDPTGGDAGWSPVYRLLDGTWCWNEKWPNAYRHDDWPTSTPYGTGTQLEADRKFYTSSDPCAFYQYMCLNIPGSGQYTLHLDFYFREESATTASSVDNWEILILDEQHSSWEGYLWRRQEPNCDEHWKWTHETINIDLTDHSVFLLIGHWDSWFADWEQGHSKYFNELSSDAVDDLNGLDPSGGETGWSPVYRQRNNVWRWDQYWESTYRHNDSNVDLTWGQGTKLEADRSSTASTAPGAFYQYRKLVIPGFGGYILRLDFWLREDSKDDPSSVDNWEMMVLSDKHDSWQNPLWRYQEPNCDEHGILRHQIFEILLTDHEIYLLIGHWDSWYADWEQGHTKYFKSIEILPAPSVALIVENDLWTNYDIQTMVNVYRQDLNDIGYTTYLYTDPITNIQALRTLLQNYYNDYGISGALLIGDLPEAVYQYDENFLCELYLMDLDGTWQDLNSDGYFDQHTATSPADIEPEIFVSRIDASMRTYGMNQPWEDIFYLLYRFHEYRTGSATFRSHQALMYVDDDWASYPWGTWLDDAYPTHTGIYTPPESTSGIDWLYTQLSQDYEFAHLWCHSGFNVHEFRWIPLQYIWSSQIHNQYVANPQSFNFLNLFCCHAAEWTKENSLAVTYLFSGPNSLAVIGSTKSAGMLDGENFYDNLAKGKSIGQAFSDWFQDMTEIGDYVAWYYGMCIQGDPFFTIYGR